ncbi:MAG TPA: roadblock/LC7 domain-containing protein, partial [Actinomycetes bacterium]|nr:roadblock/LC7 domain-containing protein [Actinomycetes bacterium]
MSTLSAEAANFSWLLGNFVKSVPGVQHTLVVSADGLLMAMSAELDRTQGDQLA